MLDASTRLAGIVFSEDQQQAVVNALSQIQAQIMTLRYALDSIADYAGSGINMGSETRAVSMTAAQLQEWIGVLGHSVGCTPQQPQQPAQTPDPLDAVLDEFERLDVAPRVTH